jgi:hypothetical protein
MRAAIDLAATRRGCSRTTRPASTRLGGTRVVLPAPGAAMTTAARAIRNASRIASIYPSIGSGISDFRIQISDSIHQSSNQKSI